MSLLAQHLRDTTPKPHREHDPWLLLVALAFVALLVVEVVR